jgi:hypothetical protein
MAFEMKYMLKDRHIGINNMTSVLCITLGTAFKARIEFKLFRCI